MNCHSRTNHRCHLCKSISIILKTLFAYLSVCFNFIKSAQLLCSMLLKLLSCNLSSNYEMIPTGSCVEQPVVLFRETLRVLAGGKPVLGVLLPLVPLFSTCSCNPDGLLITARKYRSSDHEWTPPELRTKIKGLLLEVVYLGT